MSTLISRSKTQAANFFHRVDRNWDDQCRDTQHQNHAIAIHHAFHALPLKTLVFLTGDAFHRCTALGPQP